jgi:hypothetical protein
MTATMEREATTAAAVVEHMDPTVKPAKPEKPTGTRDLCSGSGTATTAAVEPARPSAGLPWSLAAGLPGGGGMRGPEHLARRARVLEHLAVRFRDAAERAHGPRRAALRQAAREMQTEAVRFTLAATATQAAPGENRLQQLTTT